MGRRAIKKNRRPVRTGRRMRGASSPNPPCCCGGGPCGPGGNCLPCVLPCDEASDIAYHRTFNYTTPGSPSYTYLLQEPYTFCCNLVAGDIGRSVSVIGYHHANVLNGTCPGIEYMKLMDGQGTVQQGSPQCTLGGTYQEFQRVNCGPLTEITNQSPIAFSCPASCHDVENTLYSRLGTFLPGNPGFSISGYDRRDAGSREHFSVATQISAGIQVEYVNYIRISWAPNCPDPVGCPPRGACCCGTSCWSQTTQQECSGAGGTWLGAGSVCSAGACSGTCCLPDGRCLPVPAEVCARFQGQHFPWPSDCNTQACAPPARKGACCNTLTGACTHTEPWACPSPHVFHGLGSTCESLARPGCVQPLGRCCTPTPQGSWQCGHTTQQQCLQTTGAQWGGGGTTCQNLPCPPGTNGACCLTSGECQQVPNASTCASLNGVFLLGGDCGTTPSENPCVRACCNSRFGSPRCDPVPIAVCTQPPYNGTVVNQPGCNPDPCYLGACCCNGQCSQSTELECLALTGCFWFGQGQPCSPNPCNFGVQAPPRLGAEAYL
jgi:hypothetical protein